MSRIVTKHKPRRRPGLGLRLLTGLARAARKAKAARDAARDTKGTGRGQAGPSGRPRRGPIGGSRTTGGMAKPRPGQQLEEPDWYSQYERDRDRQGLDAGDDGDDPDPNGDLDDEDPGDEHDPGDTFEAEDGTR